MNILIDTHILLWWLTNNSKLPKRAEELITNQNNTIFVSVVCSWEIAIKQSIGRLDVDLNIIEEIILNSGFSILAISMSHSLKIAELPKHHNDPFDRLLVAQCLVESMQLLTHDEQIKKYGDFVISV